MKTNRLPLGLVVFNSEINPPKGGSSPGSSPPVLLGGWCGTCTDAGDDDLIKLPSQTRGLALGSRVDGEICHDPRSSAGEP